MLLLLHAILLLMVVVAAGPDIIEETVQANGHNGCHGFVGTAVEEAEDIDIDREACG